jgi:hypothetical protein
MIDATNSGDSEGFLSAFADDAVIQDWGREFAGKSEIARWNDNENIGTQSKFQVNGFERTGNEVTVKVEVTGGGFNGPSTFVFELEDGLIKRFVISG